MRAGVPKTNETESIKKAIFFVAMPCRRENPLLPQSVVVFGVTMFS